MAVLLLGRLAYFGNPGALENAVITDTDPGQTVCSLRVIGALHRLKAGGLYLIDDMLPQPSWPADHAAKVTTLICALEKRTDLHLVKLGWSTGLMVATKKA